MSTNKKTPKHGLEAGDPDAWEPAQLVVARPTSVMLSVRVPAELVIQLEAYAEKRSIIRTKARWANSYGPCSE